jgi:hypothetical protein
MILVFLVVKQLYKLQNSVCLYVHTGRILAKRSACASGQHLSLPNFDNIEGLNYMDTNKISCGFLKKTNMKKESK